MNKSNLKIFILIFIFVLFGINDLFSQNDSIRTYYEEKYKAEMLIIDSNYKEASTSYQNAFQFLLPFPRDLFNAVLVAGIAEDSAFAKDCYHKLMLLGFLTEDLMKTDGMKYLDAVNNPFVIWLQDDQQLYSYEYTLSAKPKVRSIIDSLLTIDQKYRGGQSVDTMIYYDSMNIAFIKNYTAKNGFPGYYQRGGPDSISSFPFSMNVFWIIHWHQRGYNSDLDTILLQAVLDGKYEPDNYAMCLGLKENVPLYHELLENPWATLLYIKNKEPLPEGNFLDQIKNNTLDIVTINKNREAIYLDKFEDMLQKARYEYLYDQRFHLISSAVFAFNSSFYKYLFGEKED